METATDNYGQEFVEGAHIFSDPLLIIIFNIFGKYTLISDEKTFKIIN